MLFNVPQYIDVEDKIVGPLTGKQLLWMIGMGIMLLVLWNTVSRAIFFIAGIPLALIFIAFAFYRPYNQPLIKFIIHAILFLFRPKVYTWRRTAKRIQVTKKKEIYAPAKKDKSITRGDIEALAKTLDTEGMEKNERIIEMIDKDKK
ncbi:prgI family protein [bacterium BMS3Abin15]|nr:prgI family protein [bacterium BMS3Abin15]